MRAVNQIFPSAAMYAQELRRPADYTRPAGGRIPRRRAGARLWPLLAGLWSRLWAQRHRSPSLEDLDDRMLRDIGLRRDEMGQWSPLRDWLGLE